MVKHLIRRTYRDQNIRWTFILQPGAVAEFQLVFGNGRDIRYVEYPYAGPFDFEKLRNVWSGAADAAPVGCIFIPVNNSLERGYGGILEFAEHVKPGKIMMFTLDGRLRQTTLAAYRAEQRASRIRSVTGGAYFIAVGIPLIGIMLLTAPIRWMWRRLKYRMYVSAS